MRFGAIINAYNEIEWFETTLTSILDHFDVIVITEGAYQHALAAGARPRSDDGTKEIAEHYAKNYDNIVLLHENEKNQAEQLNKGLKIIKEKNIDWLFVIDGDEVWQAKDLNMMKNLTRIGDKKGIYQYRANFYNFTNSFDQYYNAEMKRVFKITPGCEFVGGNENMWWPDHGKDLDRDQKADHLSVFPVSCRGFHYTEIKHKDRWLLKRDYLLAKDGNKQFAKWHVDENGFNHGNNKKFYKFEKEHPKIVQEHYLYKAWLEGNLKQILFSDKKERSK